MANLSPYWKKLDEKYFSKRSVSKLFKHYDTVYATPEMAAKDERSKTVLGAIGSNPGVVLLDFQGNVQRRWLEKLPTRTKLTKSLKLLAEHNHKIAERFRGVEQAVKKALYAFELKEYRKATLAYVKMESVELPVESEPAKQRAKLLKKISTEFDKREKKAEEKADGGDEMSAIEAYELLMRDFPLPDRKVRIQKRLNELWRKVRGGSGSY